jgi:hypothetical protein
MTFSQDLRQLLTDSSHTNAAPLFDWNVPRPQSATLLPIEGHSRVRRGLDEHHVGRLYDQPAVERIDPAVEISPSDIVRRRSVTWNGMAAEIVQATMREKIEFRFRGPRHLLAVYDQSARSPPTSRNIWPSRSRSRLSRSWFA